MYQHIQQGLNNCISENCANYRKRRLAPVSTHRPGRADQRLWTETSQRSHCRLWSPSVRSFWYCCLVAKSCLFAKSCSFDTPWTVARQAPLLVGFPRQEYWSGLPFPYPLDGEDPPKSKKRKQYCRGRCCTHSPSDGRVWHTVGAHPQVLGDSVEKQSWHTGLGSF